MRLGPIAQLLAAYGGAAPTTDPWYANVSLLLHGDGANLSTTFTDSSQYNHTVTPSGNARLETGQFKYGAASMAFSGGSSSWATVANHAAFDFGAGDFTIEFWMRPATVSGNALVAGKFHSALPGSWLIYRSGATLQFYASSGGGTWDIANGISIGTVAANTWYHVAISRNAATFRTFLDGVAGATATSSAALYSGTQSVAIGANTNGGDYYSGHIDDLRLTKGVARYLGAFTPPAAAFFNS